MEKKQNIIWVIVCIILSISSFFIGYHRRNRYSELYERCANLESELKQRIDEIGEYQNQLDRIGIDVSKSIDFVEQSRIIIGQLGDSVQYVTETSGNISDIIRQLKRNQSELRNYIEQLQLANQKLAEELGRLQECINQ